MYYQSSTYHNNSKPLIWCIKELYLGNVLAVVSDKKIPIDDDGLGNQDGIINYYQPDIKQSMDYSPFGVILQDRTKRCTTDLTTVNVLALDNHFDSGTEGYVNMGSNTTLSNVAGRLRATKGSGSGALGCTKTFAITDIGNNFNLSFYFDKGNLNGNYNVICRIINTDNNTTVFTSPQITATNSYSYTLSNLVVGNYRIEFERFGNNAANKYFELDDVVLSYDTEQLITTCVDNNVNNSFNYRYGWNKGSENDNEITGVKGSHITTFFREYDTRLARTWSLDPKGGQMPWQSPYVSMDNSPIKYNDPLGDEVKNGDRLVANKQKEKANFLNKKLTEFKSEKGITSDTKRRSFIKSGGHKADWKEYKNLRGTAKTNNALAEKMAAQAKITDGIISKWEKSAPQLFGEVDKQDVDFVLFSQDGAKLLEKGIGGSTNPAYLGTPENPILFSKEIPLENALTVIIGDNVNITTKDVNTGQFNLNHEAGHFLYMVKYTKEFLKIYYQNQKNGVHHAGGHAKNDESGKVAEKFGKMKDVPNAMGLIKKTGN